VRRRRRSGRLPAAFATRIIPFPECENISSGTANPLHVTLLVADDDDGQSLRDALGPGVVAVEADAVSDAVARHDPDVAVVDADAVADPGGVVAAIRSGGGGLTVVSVGAAETDADVTCPSRNADAVRAAVDRARRVAEYRRSVSDLYEQCKNRAFGRPDEALRESRADADSRLADLPDDRWAVAAALRPDAGDEGNDTVDGRDGVDAADGGSDNGAGDPEPDPAEGSDDG
jgi:hypothetical protein